MNAQPGGPEPERLRTPPSERFAGPSHLISLRSVLKELRAEKHPARNGHRQITLFHRAPVTQVLFSFAKGGHLDEHAAHGVVTIHVLEGCLRVEVEGGKNELPAGHLLILDPDVPHDVYASEESAMLLTVHLQTE